MHKYKLSSRLAVIAQNAADYLGGVMIQPRADGHYFLGCCGLAGIRSFDNRRNAFTDWNDKAEYIACLYRGLYGPAHAVYALTDQQLENPVHLALLEIGAVELAVFPNLYHGPRIIHLFKVNIRNAVGRFCNKYGEAYAVPPADESEVEPEQVVVITDRQFAALPIR